MTISATLPVASMDAVNASLKEQGFGPNNFSVPLRTGTDGATHVGLHAWDDSAFLAALEALQTDYPELELTSEGSKKVNFGKHVAAKALQWEDPSNWFENPVMTGDQRALNGKTWESTTDYNVWQPGVSGWREVVSEGYPEWVQPTGGHDAYSTGDRVTFEGADYESVIDANVWSPTGYPAGWSSL